MTETQVTTGAIIRRLRRDRRWTLQDLSEHTDISRSQLGKIETGKARATVEVLSPIAAAFGIDPQFLVPPSPLATQADCTQMLATMPPGMRTAVCNLIFAYHVGL